MRRLLAATLPLLLLTSPARAYIEAPHSLGKCVQDSTAIVLMEVSKINTEKNLIIFKKLADIKGKHPVEEIKHNIGKKGFHEREWKNIMAWAEVGKKAVFMYNGDASETCIGTYWYQAYREGDWWGMSHAEPFLLRSYYGDAEKLAEICKRVLKGEEVVVTCLADGSKEQLHQRKGKLQRLKVSLKKQDYNQKRDFVGWGGDGEDFEEFKTTEIVKASTGPWRYASAQSLGATGGKWIETDFDDSKWKSGNAPLGYGEPEILEKKGTVIEDKGQEMLFRRVVDIPASSLDIKGATYRLNIASDDSATVFLNGRLIDKDPEADHEFMYWNREVELKPIQLKPGKNVIAVQVRNKAQSSDLFFDLELIAQVPVPKPKKKELPKTAVAANPKESPFPKKVPEEPLDPNAIKVDKAAKTVTISGVVAIRKLPNLDQKYPIEVIGTYPAPRGQKAHETVLTFKGVRPSDVHKALESLALKPGKPAYGEGTQAAGPKIKVFVELMGKDGKPTRVPIEKCLVHRDNGKPMVPLIWHFTGSVVKQPDPEKDDKVYGADLTGTFFSLFPVTDCCVLQTHLTMKDEPNFKLETDSKVLPAEGSAIKLVLIAE